jgi:uncharacterized protein YchJ
MEIDVPLNQFQKIKDDAFKLFEASDDEEEEDETTQSTSSFLYHQFREFYIDNIPVEIVKQLPHFGNNIIFV